MGRMMEQVNGWMTIFRVVTPALLALNLWMLQDVKMEQTHIKNRLTIMANEYLHELASIKERLGRLEERTQRR